MAVPVPLSCWHLGNCYYTLKCFGGFLFGVGREAGVRGHNYFSLSLCSETGSCFSWAGELYKVGRALLSG